jgi:pilus assembly protein CpaF
MVRFRPQVEALDEGAIDSSINEPHRPMTQHTTSTGAESTADAEGHLVAELCRRVARRRGDVATLVDDEVRRLAPLSTPADQRRLAREAVARLSGLGDLEELVADPTIDEVLVNDGREIWIERAGALERVGLLDGQPVEHLIERILAPIGRRLDRTTPIVDARLASGARVCAVVPPVAVDGTSLSIRRFSATIRPLESFTDDTGLDLCRALIAERCNVIVCGATSSGKTSLLASLTTLVPDNERVLVLEDTAELPVAGRHTVRLEARPATADLPTAVTLDELVRTALRLRPDRLVVGEIRGPEVLGLVQAMNTGHDGSFSTCHANSPLDALLRLESLVLQAAPTWPLVAIRQQLARSIDVVVHVARHGDGFRRIESISEICVPEAGDALVPPALRVLGRQRPDGFELHGSLSRGRASPAPSNDDGATPTTKATP